MIKKNLDVINKLGLHARASARFVSAIHRLDAEVTISGGGYTFDAKRIMSVMMIGMLGLKQITITANGDDEEKVIDILTELLADRFGEDE